MKKTNEFLEGLVKELSSLSNETGWLEFKTNNAEPDKIGEYISALSNSAAIADEPNAYMIWGIDDHTHEIVGTNFKPTLGRKGGEELENWLLRSLSPRQYFKFYEIEIEGNSVVLLEIEKASYRPVQFKGTEYIRIGSYKKLLKDFPEMERVLWKIFDKSCFEEAIAMENIGDSEVIKYLDHVKFFELLGIPLYEDLPKILEKLSEEEMIVKNNSGNWNIYNLGAILFARNLSDFKFIRRKSVRVIEYKGNSRIETLREQEGARGYACGFEGLIEFINNLLPINEVIGKALRKQVLMYPQLAIRELVANAIIHQDFSLKGTGPMIEIFSDRIEITNPGKPLVRPERFLDTPPKSRNETMASFMRRIGICEERGSGFDKVVFETELYQLPAPIVEVTDEHTKVTLLAHIPFKDMSKEDKIRACYLHSCLKYVTRDYLTNTTLRNRFGLDSKEISIVSRIIRDTISEGMIRPLDPDTAPRYLKYVPFWA